MAYHDQWQTISGRIRGLMQSAHLYARFLSVNSEDPYGSSKQLHAQITSLQSSLKAFRDNFQEMLPPSAIATMESFLNHSEQIISDNSGGPGARKQRVWAALVQLGAFETELSFILSDSQQSIRVRSERAFAHLQRSIVADQECREKWKGAFESGEVSCEKLGAVHLLWHGIFAFKVDAAGERTDLVFHDRVGPLTDEQRYADGLVLTEWKKAASENQAKTQFAQARSQAKRYSKGALAGNELTSYRYAIVVSPKNVEVPDDISEDGLVFRHINIAVDPQSPSR